MLLFRKSDFLQSRIVTRRFFFRNKTFLFVVRMSWNFVGIHEIPNHESSQNFSSFGQLYFFEAPCNTNWIIQLVTWGVTNRDVLLLATIRCLTIFWSHLRYNFLFFLVSGLWKGSVCSALGGLHINPQVDLETWTLNYPQQQGCNMKVSVIYEVQQTYNFR